MTFVQEFNSWFAPPAPTGIYAADPPKIGTEAPRPSKLALEPSKQTIIAFLRHCGCPFAEKTFLNMREAAKVHRDIDFIAVSHSEEDHTQKWLKSLPQYGSEPPNLHVIVDSEREIYAAYGLGASSWAHVLAPSALSSVFQLSKSGISNRPTESGSRWQTSGTYAIGADGRVKWGGPASRSDDMPDFEVVVREMSQ
ncbi:hypothetical protein DOTSEDRAFT_20860 [Dothistroma septosporum NZE10]|uniref:Uncharacterized protein n=1 Tax=Dothistroma septosporum (strain NZE10 / CBS 128990) TaxID=675120 RepID=N1PXV6_DOTSN|nr:hypothetical protein DOTSEDRAFT_20860 [Dothistroma septosporum NZE10]